MHHHDALWKGLLQALFPDFLELVIPEISARLKPEEGRFLEQESFSDLKDGHQALLDLVAEVPSRDGQEEVILIHVEVERAFGVAMDRRMWRYFFHLSLKYKHPILPIVLFLRGGEGGVTRRHVEHRVGDFVVNRFSYFSLGLSGWPARPLLERGPLGIALASCARGDRVPRDELKYLCMEAILESGVNDALGQLLFTAIETYLRLNEEQEMKYAERVSESARSSEMQTMELTWAGELHQSGVELGRREGVELGRREGVVEGRLATGRRLLHLILTERFGEPPPAFGERLDRVRDPARLEELSRQALLASSFEEVAELIDSGS